MGNARGIADLREIVSPPLLARLANLRRDSPSGGFSFIRTPPTAAGSLRAGEFRRWSSTLHPKSRGSVCSMTIHWGLFVPGVLLLLFPADRLLSPRVELRSFDCFQSL